MSNTPQTLKGFRDFLPQDKRVRNLVAQNMSQVFELHGFEPLETPSLEYADLLLGKYGEEAEKLVYTFEDKGGRKVGLRYDQTVPSSRVLAQYQAQLPKFFRRYQIQNVFRADKPQKGRYREFVHCDCDIFGTSSPIADAEILSVFYDSYASVGLNNIIIEINDRQTLMTQLATYATKQVSVFSIIQTIDKSDKKSEAEIIDELISKGLTKDMAEEILTNLNNTEMSIDLYNIAHNLLALGVPESSIKFNPKLARGLDYYTGLIFEAKIPDFSFGSLGGGGRYDKLIKQLSGIDMPAVGFGIGFDRVVEAVTHLQTLKIQNRSADVLVTIFSADLVNASLKLTHQLRQAGIKTELYPEEDKLGKQFKLADQKQIPFVAILGEEEVEKEMVSVKEMSSGNQEMVSIKELIRRVKQ